MAKKRILSLAASLVAFASVLGGVAIGGKKIA